MDREEGPDKLGLYRVEGLPVYRDALDIFPVA